MNWRERDAQLALGIPRPTLSFHYLIDKMYTENTKIQRLWPYQSSKPQRDAILKRDLALVWLSLELSPSKTYVRTRSAYMYIYLVSKAYFDQLIQLSCIWLFAVIKCWLNVKM